MDGPCNLREEIEVLVGKEPGNAWMMKAAQDKNGNQFLRGSPLPRPGQDQFRFFTGGTQQAHDAGMAQVGISIVVLTNQGKERIHRLGTTQLADGNGCQGTHPDGFILQKGQHCLENRCMPGVPHNPGHMQANLRILVLKETNKRLEDRGILATQLAKTPDAVQACQLMGLVPDRGQQGTASGITPANKFKLAAPSHPHVRMPEESGKLFYIQAGAAGGKNFPRLHAKDGLGGFRVIQLPDATPL